MEDTICGISTSMGNGAISIIRVSGKDAILIVNKIFSKDLLKKDSHTITYGHIVKNDEQIDEVLLMLMKGPKTYTTEDIVEINCHGGAFTTKKVLELLLLNGARLAEPGEFTKRAFLNGRIDLTKAEAVNDLIMAKTEASTKLALNAVNGIINEKISNLREKMVKLLSNIEVNIDYPEYEDELEVTNELLHENLYEIENELNKIIKDSENGRLINNGINIAIVGRPNVGKSSLLNNLLDEEKAIVTNIPGTTRDIVEGSITLNGVQVNLIDTAGIRETNDIVEKIGVDKSNNMIQNSDLVILVLNGNEKLSAEDLSLLEKTNNEKRIVFINKSDLDKNIDYKDNDVIYGNTINHENIDLLKEKIIEKFNLDLIINKDMAYLSNIRQINLVKQANLSIKKAIKSLENNMSVDMIEIDIKSAWNDLGTLTGEVYEDELVDNIFKNFCLGK